MRKNLYSAFMAVCCAMLVSGCSGVPDPHKEFGMYLNSKQLKVNLGEPVGYIQELEGGYSYRYRYSIVYPLNMSVLRSVPRPGILIEFDPAEVELGKEIAFGTGRETTIRLEYHPIVGHQHSKAVMLAYSSGHSAGGGKIRFDVLEPRLGGRVKGSVIQSTLYGYYEAMETMEITEPSKLRKLELFNWSFDLTLESSIF